MKLWLTEASQFIFNHLQTVVAKTAVNYCRLSFQFGLIPRKKYFVPLVRLPELFQILVGVRLSHECRPFGEFYSHM